MSVKFKLDWDSLEEGDKVNIRILDHDLTWWKANGLNPGAIVEATYNADCDSLDFPEETGCACCEEHINSGYAEAVIVADAVERKTSYSLEDLIVINIAATNAALVVLNEVPGVPKDVVEVSSALVDDMLAFIEER